MQQPDGMINPPHGIAIKQAYVRRYGQWDARGYEYVRKAMLRVESDVTTVEMEVKRLEKTIRLW